MKIALSVVALLASFGAMTPRPTLAAEPVLLAPTPHFDAPLAKAPRRETAILSGGCFWGMQTVYQHVKGVREAISGYTGGTAATAHYEDVSTGNTGQAESLKIVFDPSIVSYGTLLRIYVSVAANPTELNYQGPDAGTQYRGEIWVANAAQRRIAAAYLEQLAQAHVFGKPIVTRIDAARPFYPAEAYHQNFAVRHPDNFYIEVNDAPKVAALRRLFPDLYVAKPVLVKPGAVG
ncbi:MAG: peptide-methionine (S)-S-oxide reductase MsrA [Acidiphilium sp.]